MTTYYNGLEVPKTNIEYFVATTSGLGYATLDLAYVPTHLEEIIVSAWVPADILKCQLHCRVTAVSEKTITIRTLSPMYEKTDTPTNTTDTQGGGAIAEPHSHTLGHTATFARGVGEAIVDVAFSIIYHPIGGS